MKRGLIFDLDGTLVDSLPGISASLTRALTNAGLGGHPPAVVRGFIGDGARVLVERAAPGADDALLRKLENDFKADYDVTWPDGTVPYDGVPDLLETLLARGHALAVLSNKPHAFTDIIVARLFPGIPFACVLGQRTGIPHKPDPAGALEISKTLGVSPGECTVIGDSTIDLETGRNAGMQAVAVSWGYHDRDRLVAAGAARIADDPAELLTLIG